MSKHWQPRIVEGGRRPRSRRSRRSPPSLKELGATVAIGLAAGLSLAWWPSPDLAPKPDMPAPVAAATTVDPWAESRRSRAILEGQEAPPPAAMSAEARAGVPSVRASPVTVRVIDGDTFDYAGTRIRVADIDTPEIHGRCPSESALAMRATSRMRALLLAGPFTIERSGTRDVDIYGRQLRIVTRGGRSLGDQLVAEGLARPWRGHREPWC